MCRGKRSLKAPFRSKQQSSVPANSNSTLYIKVMHLCSIGLQIYHPWLWQLSRTLTLPLIPPSIPVSLWFLFQAISYALMTELGFSGFDSQCSLKDLVCTDPLALLMPEHVRKILPSHLPLGPEIQDWIPAHLQGHSRETPQLFRQFSNYWFEILLLLLVVI